MISVDIEQLNKISNKINSHIDSYEETLMNLFNKLKDATNDWYDSKSVAFDEAMITENNDSQNFLGEIKLRKEIISFIIDKYNNLGKKIKCDLDNKEKLINKVDYCISECTSIINEFNKIDNSFYYPEYYIILNQKAKVVDARAKLRSLREKLTGKFQKIADYEEDIDSKIDELEPFIITEFDSNYITGELIPTVESYLYSDLLSNDIKNIDMYKDEENKELNSIFDEFNKISNGYVSSNVANYKNDCKELKKNIPILEKNREKYIQEFETQLVNYENTTIMTKNVFKEKTEKDKNTQKSDGEE